VAQEAEAAASLSEERFPWFPSIRSDRRGGVTAVCVVGVTVPYLLFKVRANTSMQAFDGYNSRDSADETYPGSQNKLK
jgi:hypothetical protein